MKDRNTDSRKQTEIMNGVDGWRYIDKTDIGEIWLAPHGEYIHRLTNGHTYHIGRNETELREWKGKLI